jgi:hypothetical protein
MVNTVIIARWEIAGGEIAGGEIAGGEIAGGALVGTAVAVAVGPTVVAIKLLLVTFPQVGWCGQSLLAVNCAEPA